MMNTINKILCPVDFSPNAQNALRYALKIADQWNATVEVMHVVYPQTEGLDFPVMVTRATNIAMDAAKETMSVWIENTIIQAQAGYNFQEVPMVIEHVELGTAVNAILSFAAAEEFDLIIMGTKGSHNQLEKLLGTVSGEVIRRSPCPVLLVPEGADFHSIKRVSFASNLLASDCYYVWKMIQLLKPFNPSVDCVHIQTKTKEHTSIDQQDLNLFFNFTMPELQIRVFNLKEEDISTGLDNFTETDRSDILVMFKPKENWLQRLLFTSETKKMALVSKIPLLVLV